MNPGSRGITSKPGWSGYFQARSLIDKGKVAVSPEDVRDLFICFHISHQPLYSTHCVTCIGSLLFFTLQGLYIVPQISSIDLWKFYVILPKALYHLHLLQMPATTKIRLTLSSYMCNLPLCKPKALCLIWAALWRTVLPSLCTTKWMRCLKVSVVAVPRLELSLSPKAQPQAPLPLKPDSKWHHLPRAFPSTPIPREKICTNP